LAEAKQEYSDVAGKHAVMTLCTTHATYNQGQGATTKHFNTATMEFLQRSGLMRAQAERVDEGTGEKVVRPRNKL